MYIPNKFIIVNVNCNIINGLSFVIIPTYSQLTELIKNKKNAYFILYITIIDAIIPVVVPDHFIMFITT